MRALLDGAGLRLEFSKQQLQQSALANAVVSHQPESVAPHDLQVEPRDQRLVAVTVTDVLRLQDLAAGALGLTDADARRAGALDALGAFLPQRLEGAHPALVAGPARLDALPHPGFLAGKLAIELRVLPLFLLDGFRLAPQVVTIVARPADQLAAIYFGDPRGQPLQKCPVMGDEQHRARPVDDALFQPLDG